MVHALRQARRVLKNDGYLLDLRPALLHRRVGIERDGAYQQVAVMRELLNDDYAANAAVNSMVDSGLLKIVSRCRFDCTRRMDRFSEFQTWLEDPVRLRKLRSPDKLSQKVRRALKEVTGQSRIVVRGPIDLRVLVKT